LRPPQCRLWLLSCALLLTLTAGCRQNTDVEPTPQDVAKVSPEASKPVDAEPIKRPPPALTPLARVDADGTLFGIAIDELGNVMVTTLRGRKAVYVVTPEQDLHKTPIALEVEGFASFPFAVGRGLFAIPLPTAKTVEFVRIDVSTAEPTLQRVGSIKTAGVPAQVLEAFGLLWFSQRHDLDGGIGLLAVEPATGKIVVSLPTEGEVPVEMTRLLVDKQEKLFLTTRNDGGGAGHVMTVTGADAAPTSVAVTDGVPMRVFSIDGEETARPLLLRYETPTVLDLQTLETAFRLPFAPHLMATNGGGVFAVSNPAGELARVARGSDGGEATLHRMTEPGVVAIEFVDSLLFVLNSKTHTLSLRSKADLEENAVVTFEGEPGRMVVDRARQRVYLTLPELQQIAVLSYSF